MNAMQRMGLGAAAGSVAFLLGALAFQYLGGLAPCHLCIWQRWPHGIAMALGLLLLVWPMRGLTLLGALTMLAGAGIGLYHTGIERGWWPGPASCTAPTPGDVPAADLLDQILATPVVLCDEVAWSMLGLSMASWNAIGSLLLAWLWWRAYASSSASQ
jgi:disulfide bond formation protein DsbB